jgi:16S rRNA (adenine1518-N6/adenine1519-N6)-dimethyltransferase
MSQREVADRLVAKPGGKVMDASPSPRGAPRSPIVRHPPRASRPTQGDIDRGYRTWPAPLAPADSSAEKVVAAAFGQRRKMLRQSLRTLTPKAETLLDAVGIDGTARAETLTIEQFCALARAYSAGSGPTGPREAP